VEFVLARFPAATRVRVLDVGTGSGAIALGIKQARPTWEITATDASEEALAFARANGERLELAVHWAHGHLAQQQQGPFDLIVANLPYIGEGERAQCDPELAFEPQRALFSGADGLDLIGELIADVSRLLTPTGEAMFEHGWTQSAAISAIAQANGFTATTICDLAGKDRFAHLTRAV
jgi:release factor glutamine methyltransferase